jgi:hypothetical protein
MRVSMDGRASAFETDPSLREPPLAWTPSPWATSPPVLPTELLARSRSGSELLGGRWWVWLWVLALAIASAALWLSRLRP